MLRKFLGVAWKTLLGATVIGAGIGVVAAAIYVVHFCFGLAGVIIVPFFPFILVLCYLLGDSFDENFRVIREIRKKRALLREKK